MTLRTRAAQTLLFATLVVWAIWLGGQVFNATTFVAGWSGDLPRSLAGWCERLSAAFPASSGQGAFFSLWGNLMLLLVPATLGTSWHLRARRPWLAAATGVMLVIAVMLFSYMVREQAILTSAGNGGIAGAELVSRAQRWVMMNRIRMGLELAGFLCLLRALSIPPLAAPAPSAPAPHRAAAREPRPARA